MFLVWPTVRNLFFRFHSSRGRTAPKTLTHGRTDRHRDKERRRDREDTKTETSWPIDGKIETERETQE
jgi:hypothetical protein